MPDVEHLSPEASEFVERAGVFYEQYGLPRIGGRLLGLLLLADRPLTLDDIAGALHVSRASVSTNVRIAANYGFAEQVSLPGDRRDYYQFPADGWDRAMLLNIQGAKGLLAIAEKGLAAVKDADPASQERLKGMVDFCEIVVDDSYAILERWRAYRQAQEKKRA